jgi:outer membrane lipopolysaccharide assembly protein LptE/RlpB
MNSWRLKHMKKTLIISLMLAVFLSGCGYSIQGRANLPFDRVTVSEIKNSTGEPKLQDRMHRLLAETFMEYGVDIVTSARYRIEVDITDFRVYPVAERNLQAIEYQLTVNCKVRVIDMETRKVAEIGAVEAPYLVYFRSSGLLVSVLAEKETATEKALKDLSQEIVMRIAYQKPAFTEDLDKKDEKKGEKKGEPKAVPAGK